MILIYGEDDQPYMLQDSMNVCNILNIATQIHSRIVLKNLNPRLDGSFHGRSNQFLVLCLNIWNLFMEKLIFETLFLTFFFYGLFET